MIHIASKLSGSSLSSFDVSQVQPNAIDLRIDKLYMLKNLPFRISEDEKVHRGTNELPTSDGWWHLYPGQYEIIMEGTVKMAPDEAGFVITRSTLNRNGLFITSGLYDSGYEGVMAGCLHVSGGRASIKKGSRVGQFLLFKAESLHQYDGDYGTGKEHDQKYA